MTSGTSIEQMLISEFRVKIEKKVESLKDFIISNPLPQEEYILHVGSVKALTETLEDLDNSIKTFFTREI